MQFLKSKSIAHLTPILHKIPNTIFKIIYMILKRSVATSVATFIPSYMWKLLIKNDESGGSAAFEQVRTLELPYKKSTAGRPVVCRKNYRFRRCNFGA